MVYSLMMDKKFAAALEDFHRATETVLDAVADQESLAFYERMARLVVLCTPNVPVDEQEFAKCCVTLAEQVPDKYVLKALEGFYLKDFSENPELREASRIGLLTVKTFALWEAQGKPIVSIEPRLAASLVLTDVPPEVLETLHWPWDAFKVKLPDLFDGFDTLIVGRNFRHGRDRLFAELSGNGLHQSAELRIEELFREDSPKVGLMAMRLAVGIALIAAQEQGALRPKSTKKAGSAKWRAPGSAPTTSEYVLSPREVRLKADLVQAVRDSIQNERKGLPKVQWVVRGHWRNQACGPKLLEHKRVWVQPYWKGKQDAPRLFKTYRAEGENVPEVPRGV